MLEFRAYYIYCSSKAGPKKKKNPRNLNIYETGIHLTAYITPKRSVRMQLVQHEPVNHRSKSYVAENSSPTTSMLNWPVSLHSRVALERSSAHYPQCFFFFSSFPSTHFKLIFNTRETPDLTSKNGARCSWDDHSTHIFIHLTECFSEYKDWPVLRHLGATGNADWWLIW